MTTTATNHDRIVDLLIASGANRSWSVERPWHDATFWLDCWMTERGTLILQVFPGRMGRLDSVLIYQEDGVPAKFDELAAWLKRA